MGKSSGSSDTTQTVKQDIPQWVTDASQSNYAQAQNVANIPYQPYTGEGVAPLNSTQNMGIGMITNAATSGVGANAIQQGINGATNAMNYQPQQVTAGQQTAQGIQNYMNPYTQDVTNATMDEINHQTGVQQQANSGAATQAGAFGGSRQGTVEAETNRNADEEANNALANLNNTAYTNAQSAESADQNRALTAAQSNQAAGLQGASLNTTAAGLLGTLGQGYDSNALQNGQAVLNAGGVQQQNQQAQDTYAQQQYAQQRAYPAQQLGILEQALSGSPGVNGTGTSTTTPTTSNGLATGLGLATAGVGLSNAIAPGAIGGLLGGGGTAAATTGVGGSMVGSLGGLMGSWGALA